MRITVEFIDHKGFWHLETAKSKKAVRKFFKALRKGSSITWTAVNHCIISQQYCQLKG